jgi:ribosome recycling factor
MIKDVLTQTEMKMKKTMETLTREFGEVRTGRAQPSLIEEMHVEYYGSPTTIRQIAAVSSPDPRTVVIQPWDANAIADIERAITTSKLGINPMNDGKVVRLSFPQLSAERREEMIKVVKDMAEKGRVALRSIRRDSNERIQKLQKDSSIAEDDSKKGQDAVQKMTDKYIKDIDVTLEKKSKDLKEF